MRQNLARFIVERLLDLDPTLPDTEGSVVYTKVVNPLLERLGTDPLTVDIENFVLSRLQAEFPSIDYASPGSVLRDLVVSPLTLLLEPLKAEVQFARNQNSLANSTALTEAEMDALLSNVFAVRNTGAYALVTVRVFFSAPRAFSVDQSVVFATSDGVTFVPQFVSNFVASDFQRSGNLYYVDIPLRSSTQTDTANVAANTIKFVNALDGVVRLTNPNASSGGVTKETNEEFLSRAERSLSERSLNTMRGIETNIRNNFSDIVSVDVVGYGDPEMQRDILQGTVVVPPGPGPLLTTTNKFLTLQQQNLSLFPFTNQISVRKSDAVTAAAKVGNFIRVSDGNGLFTDPLLSRPRRITAVAQDPAVGAADYWKLTLSDFEFWAESAVVSPPVELGYNPRSRQGTAFQLFALDGNTTYVRGAPLPFDEYVPITLPADVPPAAIPGRDFLFLVSPQENNERFIRCHPIHSRVTGGVSLSRLDSFMTAKNSIPYQGESAFTYRPGPDVTAEAFGVQVLAFGGPALSKNDQTRYDGKTKESWGAYAGAKLVKPQNNPAVTDSCSIVLDAQNGGWSVKGVKSGHHIALARFKNQVVNVNYNGSIASAATQLEWHSWGRVVSISQDDQTLTVAGMDWDRDQGAEANQTDYRYFWAVYVGEVETVGPDGKTQVSFTDQVLAPSYRVPSVANNAVHHPFTAPYKDAGFFDGDTAAATALPFSNGYVGAWVRLERSIFDVDPGIGAAPAQKLLTAFVTDLSKPTATNADRKSVSRVRYGQPGNSTAPLITKVALPYVEGSQAMAKTVFLTNPVSPPLVAPAQPPSAANPQDISGFLLPKSVGAGQYNNQTAPQFLQFFEAASAEQLAQDVSILVSGIPGSLPLIDLLPAPVTVQNNQVHLGGMTDVYIKPSASSSETTGALKLVPSRIQPSVIDAAADVVFVGSDGSLNPATPDVFFSNQLQADLATYLGLDAVTKPYAAASDLVLELLDVPATLKPKAVRLLHNVTGGARIDGSFNPLPNVINGVKWRVVRSTTLDLDTPLVVYQEGSDLITIANNAAVQSPGGFTFNVDPAALELYVSIDAGPDRGEYRVLSKALNVLQIDQIVNTTGAGLPYRIYSKQLSGVQLPLIRVSEVALSTGVEGVEIPYRHPVDIITSTFSGINDDPVTSSTGLLFLDGGSLYLRDVTAVPNKLFIDNNIGTYDVVRLEDLDEPNKYFSVISRVAANQGNLLAGDLKLDRTITSIPSGAIRFTAGHPSIGTAKLAFLSKTFVEVSPSTVFSFVDGTGKTLKFRPSFAESAHIFRADDVATDVVPSADPQQLQDYLVSASSNFIGLGIQKDDEVRVLTKVLKSSLLNAAQNLPLVSKILVLVVDDVRYSVILTGGATTTLAAIANDILAQTGGRVAGKFQTVGNQFRLDLLSRRRVAITDEGTPGLLLSLGLSVTNNYSVAQEHAVVKVDLTGVQARIQLDDVLTNLTATDTVFVDVVRNGIQRIYPADMTAQTNGLVAGTVKLTSYDPFIVDQALQDQQLTAEGYKSFGYELLVGNNQYSFSTAEQVALRVTPVMLDEAATTVEDAIPLSGSSVVIKYDRAAAVGDIQSYMLQPGARVINNNPLVRHFMPAYPLMSVQYRGPVTSEELRIKLSTFLSTLYPNRPLEVFDLVSVLERAGATYVVFPQQVAFLTHDEDRVIRVVRSQDIVTLDSKYHIMEILDGLVTITAV